MKKIISFALSAALMMSVMSPFASLGYAEEEQTAQSATVQVEAASEAESQAEQPSSASAFEQEEESSSESSDTSEEPTSEKQEAESEVVFEEECPIESALQAESEPESEVTSQPEEVASETEEQPEQASLESEELPEDGIAEFSLRPMKEITDLKLELDGYSREEYKAFSVDELMSLLKDSEDNKVEINLMNATTVWFAFGANSGDYQNSNYREEIHKLNNGETVNLWQYYSNGTQEDRATEISQTVAMVVGSGSQMDDANNTRYVFTENLCTGEKPSRIEGNLRLCIDNEYIGDSIQLNGNVVSDNFEEIGIPGVYAVYAKEGGYDASKSWYVDWNHTADERMEKCGYSISVYEADAYKADPENAQPVNVTDGRLPFTGENCKWVVVTSNVDKKIVSLYGISVTLENRKPVEGLTYLLENGQMTENPNSKKSISFTDTAYYTVSLDYTNEENIISSFNAYTSFYINEISVQQNQTQDVYLAIQNNESIQSIYIGYYFDTSYIPANAEDLKSQILVSGNAQVPYGYRLNPADRDRDGEIRFTILMNNGALMHFAVRIADGEESAWHSSFTISNLKNAFGNSVTYKAVKAAGGAQLDSYYSGYSKDVSGYQLIVLPEAMDEEQLKALVPSFYTSNSGDRVYSSGSGSSQQMISGQTNLQNALWLDIDKDGKNETVQVTVVTPDEKSKNYMITFAVQQENSSLFVPGPDERLVNLSIDNDYAHDILVANMGADDLTIESVNIENAQNVAIDDYWTIQPGSVLKGMTTTDTSYTYTDEDGVEQTNHNDYASMANMAKIRLVPSSSGVVSGTLVIKATNGTVRRIKLTGMATLPGFTTEQITEAVKYVPYAFMVATDNMYAWNEDTFELSSGTLPEGVVLKNSGEIYGTPKQSGEFTFTVKVHHSSNLFAKYPTEQQFTLIVNENSDINVYTATDEQYEIKQAIGAEKNPGSYDFYVADASKNQIFSSQADYLTYPDYPERKVYNFKGLWLNGEKLEQGVDYDAQQGSTVITIRSQTFANKANRNGANTIAMEFRVDGNEDNELKRTAQNFYMDANTSFSSGGNHSGNSDSGNAESSTGSSSNSVAGAQTTDGTYAEVGGANLTIRVLDARDATMPGVTVVLHSTPRSAVTDSVGRAYFANVEFGQHTIAVVKNGKTIATSQFVLEKSVNTAVSNGTVYSPDGGDVAFSVHVTNVGTVTLDEDSAVKLATGAVSSPKTGDDSRLLTWAILLGVAVLSTGALLIRSKKQ